MKTLLFLPALAFKADPVGQVIGLLTKLYNTVVKDGEIENKQFETFSEWCEDQAKERQNEIKTAESQADSLRAVMEKASGDISANNQRVTDLSTNIAANTKDLNGATDIRNKEHETFKTKEKELVDTVDTLRRAQSVLSHHMKGSSFAQLPQAFKDMTASLNLIVDASIFSFADKDKLKSFLQSAEEGVDAPVAAAYESHSGGILDTLADMQEKAEKMLSETRKNEVNTRHAYELLAQSLRDDLKVQNEALSKVKKQLSASAEVKGQAEGDLANTKKDLGENRAFVRDLSQNCQQRAVDHEISLKSRTEELNALREAKKIIIEATGAASSRQYDFVQIKTKTTSKSIYSEVEKKIKTMGRNDKNSALVQLAGEIKAAVSVENDPFAKVKGLIQGMIAKLLSEAQEEASHKEFCDRETSRNEASRKKLEAEQGKLDTRIERAEAGVANLKQQIADLNKALASIAGSQKAMDGMRQDEHQEFVKEMKDFKEGLRGIQGALKILRDYYQKKGTSFFQAPVTSTHSASTGSGNGIISILEIAESDFSRSIAEAQQGEDDAVEEYNTITQENDIATATKKTTVEGTTQESARLEQLITDASSDRNGVQDELSAVLEYLDKLRPQCTTEPMSYEERKARRENEIEGLKEALTIIQNETALIQTSKTSFRRKQNPI
jgi:hypothetical protein